MILPLEDRCSDCPYDERNTFVQTHCPICHEEHQNLVVHFLDHDEEDVPENWIRARSVFHGANIGFLAELTDEGVKIAPFLSLWLNTRVHNEPEPLFHELRLIDVRDTALLRQLATLCTEIADKQDAYLETGRQDEA